MSSNMVTFHYCQYCKTLMSSNTIAFVLYDRLLDNGVEYLTNVF